jgi:hypothetical protein
VKPIGKYYFSEDALKHDLAALKRGEVYERDDFYRRAKAWYKAEIDRLLHLEKVKMVSLPSSVITVRLLTLRSFTGYQGIQQRGTGYSTYQRAKHDRT